MLILIAESLQMLAMLAKHLLISYVRMPVLVAKTINQFVHMQSSVCLMQLFNKIKHEKTNNAPLCMPSARVSFAISDAVIQAKIENCEEGLPFLC